MDIFYIIIIVFAAFLIRSTFGFGDALVGMPLLVLVVSIQIAAPLMAMLALVMALMILIKNRRHVSFRLTWKLVLSAMAGIPVGLYYLKHINESVISLVLAIFIILFALSRIFEIKIKAKAPPVIYYVVGFISGILGGAYNTNGPPVIMLLSAQNWPAKKFRSTLQSYFFFVGISVVGGHIAFGNITSEVAWYFFYSLPLLLLAFFLGEYLFGKINSEKFYTWVYLLLILIGVGLMLKIFVE